MTDTNAPRRSFLARLAAGTAAIGAAIAGGASPLQAMTAREDFKPERHPQDDWFDAVPGKHRMFFDCTSPNGAGEGITFAGNYRVANRNGYNLEGKDLAVVICYRHWATCWIFNDAMWAKYGAAWGETFNFKDPGTDAFPVRNTWNATDLKGMQPNRGVTVDAAIKRGDHFAICDMATNAFAGIAARKTGGNAGAIYTELKANAVGASTGQIHFVPAGIVAVNRSQERGYSISHIG